MARTRSNGTIDDRTLAILSALEIEDQSVRITEQLDRKEYVAVNTVLEALGGNWNRRQKAHLFLDDPLPLIEDAIDTASYLPPNRHEFYETPPPILEAMLEQADLRPRLTILEPSAGDGAIINGVLRRYPDTIVIAVEIDPKRCDTLRAIPQVSVVQSDFLGQATHTCYDRVLMNPPFSRQQDVLHVMHAWEFLRPGGILVAVMSAGVTFRNNARTQQFRALLDRVGWVMPNPDDSFKASGTGVRTVLVTMVKPKE